MAFSPATLFGQQVVLLSNGLPLITFDAAITENHQRRSEVTRFETENGQTISDHIVVKPFTLSLQVLSSDSPLNIVAAGLAAGATFELQKTNVLVNANGAVAAAAVAAQAIASLFKPSQSTYQQMLALQDAKFPFDVYTTIGLYRNMWVENIGVPRDNRTGAGLIFNLELVQLLLVQSVTVNTAVFTDPNLAAGATNNGSQNAMADSAAPDGATGFADSTGLAPAPPGAQ